MSGIETHHRGDEDREQGTRCFRRVREGDLETGVRLIRLFRSSGKVRASIGLTCGPATARIDYNYPPVQMIPAEVFRLAENKLKGVSMSTQ